MSDGNGEEMEMEREELLDCLTALRPGLASTVMAQTSSYLFLGDAIAAYNDEILVYMDKFKSGFRGTVKADVLYKLIQKLNDEKVIIQFKKNVFRVKAEDTSFGLTTGKLGEIEGMLNDFKFDEMDWKKADSHLHTGIQMCSYYASKDMEEPHLTGVLVDGTDILSSDRYRISWYKLKKAVSDKPFIIPATNGIHIGRFNWKKASVHENWLHLKRGEERGKNLYICSRLIGDMSFAKDMLQHFPEKTRKGFTLPDDFVEALDRALIILEGEELLDKEIVMKVKKDKIKCEVETPHSGWIKQEVKIEGGPEKSVSIKVNPIFLREILKDIREIHIIKGEEGATMLYFSSKKFKHVISLV